MSDAALTDSTTAIASPAFAARPTAGSSMNTRSPSASCAWSVMPMVIVPSASGRTHSWLSVYLRFAGTFIVCLREYSLFHQDCAVANERRLDDSRVELPVADLHRDGVTRGNADGNAGERDRFPERGRERAAGDLAISFRRHDLLMAAQDAAFVDEHEPDQRSRGWGSDKRGLADKVAAAGAVDRPGKARFERILALRHVLAVQVHARLEPERIARAQPAEPHTGGGKRVPERRRASCRQRDL